MKVCHENSCYGQKTIWPKDTFSPNQTYSWLACGFLRSDIKLLCCLYPIGDCI